MQARSCTAVALAESGLGDAEIDRHGRKFLLPDQDTTVHVDHGSRLGVGILLSPAGVSAFKIGGAVKHVGYSSGRVMAERLLFRDLSGEDLGVHFVCAYAPTGTTAQ
jgi:hypothetical protein